jgi:hypothetical protein
MEVDSGHYALIHRQMEFAFCSEQCRACFLAHPHLYIGYPGVKAPKQDGKSVLKRRRLRLTRPLSGEGAAIVEEVLCGLMDVAQVSIAGEVIEITYDLLQVSAAEIKAALTGAGVRLGVGWTERLKRAFAHEAEEWEIEGLEVSPPRRSF